MTSKLSTTATATTTPTSDSKWFPLESNPQLINGYIQKLGFDTSMYEFCDVFSTEDWALEMIGQPVAAVLLLYPLTPKIVTNTRTSTPRPTPTPTPTGSDTCDSIVVDQTDIKSSNDPTRENIWFIKQRIGNACGTIGLLHATMNAPEGVRIFHPDSWLARFADDCPISLSPIAKAERLEVDTQIEKLHDDATSSKSNATKRGNREDKVETHFATFICQNGILFELDGRKEGPIAHGPTTQNTLLRDACTVIRNIMARDPSETRFAITALAPKSYD